MPALKTRSIRDRASRGDRRYRRSPASLVPALLTQPGHAFVIVGYTVAGLFMHPHDQRYWITRAETMRRLAKDVDDPDARAKLLKAAESYQRLADQVEQNGDIAEV